MSIAVFKDIPDLVNDLIAGYKRAIAFGLSPETKRQFMMPIKYTLQPQEPGPPKHASVRPLSSLKEEDPAKTVIIACASPIENVWEKVAPYGDFPVMNYFTLDYLNRFLPVLRDLPFAYRRAQKRDTARRGVVIRGAFMGESGLQAIQKFAADHPDDYIVVSTWETIPRRAKEELAGICDRLVLSPLPRRKNACNGNLQLACIQPGIRALLDAGVEKILVARSDYFFADPFMLESFDALLATYPSAAAQSYGQKGRLIVPDLDTRRYCPYHAGDMLTYGWAEDVARFWLPIAADERDFRMSIYSSYGEEKINFMSRHHPPIETSLGVSFMKHIGRPIQGTLEDSYCYYRDFFIPVSYAESGMFWFKRAWYDRVAFAGKRPQFVTHQLWTAMLSGRDVRDFVDVDIANASWDNYLEAM